jgi:glutaconyl-CoA/methylmalonyl-CoA decarboxylase subunit gamma
MRVTLERDGSSTTVEVASDLESVVLDGRRLPVRVVSAGALRVELEIGGEKVVVDQWPEHFAAPPAAVEVDGERWSVRVATAEGAGAGPPGTAAPPRSAAPVAPPAPRPSVPGGIPVVPPMPGRVIELRVADGDRVRAGDVLVVLEAMKMRNELTSPASGVVRGVRVATGANVPAREPMLYVLPD